MVPRGTILKETRMLGKTDLIEQIITDLKAHEGFVAHAYPDSLGYLTIGYGRMVDWRRAGGISEAEADLLLLNDIAEIARELDRRLPQFRCFPAPVQRALVNMAYQLGVIGLLAFEETIALLEQGMWVDARDEALRSQWAEQTPERAREVASWLLDAIDEEED